MAYTSEEIQAAVERLVLSKIQVPRDISGVRNNQAEFTDIQTTAAGVFISHPEAPYYVILLGSNRLAGVAQQLIASITDLETKIEATGRRTFPINDLTSLADAENSLVELETALGSRSNAIRDPSRIPSYLRFSASSLDYLEHIGRNVRADGQIVETPNQARLEIPALFNSIIASYKDVMEKQGYLQNAIDDYTNMQLPAKVAQGVVQNARDMLAEDHDDLANMGEDARLEVAKDKTLNAIAAKSVVDSYVTGQTVSDTFSATGKLVPYSDINKEAIPAGVDGDTPGPYAFISYPVPRGDPPDSRDNNVLTMTLESKQYTLILPTAFLAFIQGNGKTLPPDDPAGVFTFYKNGVEGKGYVENFDPAAPPEAWFFSLPNSTLIIEQFIEGGATTSYTVEFIGGMDIPKLFTPDVGESWFAYKKQLTLDEVVGYINGVLIGGSSYLRAAKSANNCVSITCHDPTECLIHRVVGVRCVDSIYNTAAQVPLGFFKGIELLSKRTPATSLMTSINSMTSKSNVTLAAVPLDPSLAHMSVWTDTANKSGVVLAKWTGYVAVVSSGGDITLTLGIVFDPFTNFGIQPGHIICFPRQYVKDGVDFIPIPDEGAQYIVDTVSDYTITAHWSSGPVAETYSSRNVDVGLPIVLSTVAKYQVVQIFTTPNDGGYEITSVNSYSPFRVGFDTFISQNKMARDPLPLPIDATVGPASISTASADVTTSSYIKVEGSARPLIFSTVPSARGFTTYVQLPEKYPKLNPGDRLEFRESSSVSYIRTIELVEERILTLNDSVPSNLQFDINVSTYPNVSIKSGKKKGYDTLKLNLEDVEATYPTDIDTYAANVNALLNPLLANRVPPISKVQEAKAEVGKLKDKVQTLVDDLNSVDSFPCPEVDGLISTLKSKGCDRAIDVLLQGRFSEFFGLDMDNTTYAGAMMSAAREVARNDLATSKLGTKKMQRKILAIQEDTDPDYDHSDSDAISSPPDIVAGSDMPSWSY